MKTHTLLSAFILIFLFTGISVIIGNTQHFSGDLTRIGALPDAEFKATVPDESIPKNLLVNSAITEADIIVIGDSFSAPLLWQSVLVKAGLRVHTLHWNVLDNGNVHPQTWLTTQGARPEAIQIIQLVERASVERLENLLLSHRDNIKIDDRTVQKGPSSVNLVKIRKSEEEAVQPPLASSTVNRMSTGIRLLLNRYRLNTEANFVTKYPGQSESASVSKLPKGCRWFSNVRCSQLLALNKDTVYPRFDTNTLKILEKIDASWGKKRPIWLVVPNKTSVYVEDSHQTHLLEGTANVPNLFEQFVTLRETDLDLYAPNDSHLSNRGFRRLGEIVMESILRAQRATPLETPHALK